MPHTSDIPLGILASGNGSNLEAIATAVQRGELPARIAVMVYNNPDAYARQRAERFGIPAVLVNHRDYGDREAFDRAVVSVLQQYDVGLVVMAGWMRVATQVLLDAYPDRMLNIHPSLLPSFPGLRAHEQALAYGVKIAGCTVHVVRLEVDSGPIVAQAAVPVLPDDTAETLHQRIQGEEHRLYPQAIAAYLAHLQAEAPRS